MHEILVKKKWNTHSTQHHHTSHHTNASFFRFVCMFFFLFFYRLFANHIANTNMIIVYTFCYFFFLHIFWFTHTHFVGRYSNAAHDFSNSYSFRYVFTHKSQHTQFTFSKPYAMVSYQTKNLRLFFLSFTPSTNNYELFQFTYTRVFLRWWNLARWEWIWKLNHSPRGGKIDILYVSACKSCCWLLNPKIDI